MDPLSADHAPPGSVLALAAKPKHVPNALVVDFDFYHPGEGQDIHEAFRAVQQKAPDMFWTPHYGGHWVAARAAVIEEVQRDWAHFSNRDITIPKPKGMARLYPQEADPPLHAQIRRPIMHELTPGAVAKREAAVRHLTIDLIDGFQARGECDFIADFANVLPLSIFLDLVGLPRSDRARLSVLSDIGVRSTSMDERLKALQDLASYLLPVLRQRQKNPGTDLLSTVATIQVDGKRIDETMAVAVAIPVIAAGLDTVTSMLGYIMRFLALHPSHRETLTARRRDTDFLRHAIEELIRRHGVANPGRVVVEDFDFHGIALRANEPVLLPTMLYGLDDRAFDDPMTVNFDRPEPIHHAAFGNGPHMCAGSWLARSEIRIVLEEWLARIPDFTLKPGTAPTLISGLTIGMRDLQLVW